MSKVMVLRGLPRAGAYRQPPGRVLSLGGATGAQVRTAYVQSHGLPIASAGPGAYGLTQLRVGGLGGLSGGLGSVASDKAAALSIAAGTRDVAKALCNTIIHPQDAARQARERAACVAAAEAAYAAAATAINATMVTPTVDPSDPTTTTADYMARLEEIERQQQQQQQAWQLQQQARQQAPGSKGGAEEEKILGMKKSTAVTVGIGAAVLGGVVLIMKK